MTDALLRLAHLVAVVYWIGGIFFVQFALRPALGLLEPGPRLSFMAQVLRRYFAGVALSIIAVLLSGFGMVAQLSGALTTGHPDWGRLFALHWHVYAMLALGLTMMAIYSHTSAGPMRRLTQAVAAVDWPAAASALAEVRRLALVNLLLGLSTMAVALLGRVP